MKKLVVAFCLLSTTAVAQYDRDSRDYPDPFQDDYYTTSTSALRDDRDALFDAIAKERARRRIMPAVPAKMTAFCNDKTFDRDGWFSSACASHDGIWINLEHPVDTEDTWKTIREINRAIQQAIRDEKQQARKTCADRKQTYGTDSPCQF
jgi:hypothetical protein